MDILKIIFPTVLSFFIGISITPFFTKYFYRYKMWKKSPRNQADPSAAFHNIHNTEYEISTPRLGGVIIWASVLFTVCVIYLLSLAFPSDLTLKMNFFSRSQTLVPLGAFFFAAFVGFVDDMLQISGLGAYARDALVYRKIKIALVILIGVVISLWFYYKLDFSSIHIPFNGSFELGIVFIPFFILAMLATFSTSVIDGIDGLAGGVLASVFTASALIANHRFPFGCHFALGHHPDNFLQIFQQTSSFQSRSAPSPFSSYWLVERKSSDALLDSLRHLRHYGRDSSTH